MSNQSTLAVDSPFAPTGRVAKLPTKKARSPQIPTGYYRRQGSDIWYFRRKINGVKINMSTGFTDIKDARRRGAELELAQRHGDLGWVTQVVPTVKQYYDSLSRKRDDPSRCLPFVEAHAKTRLDRITEDTCRAWMELRLKSDSGWGRPYTPGTIRVECATLKAFFERTVGARKHLRENPWKGIRFPKKSIRSRVLRREEQEGFMAALRQDDPVLERIARFAIGSGLRLKEFLGLRPCDVYEGAVHVQKEFAKGKKPRTVPVVPEVIAVVAEQMAAAGLEPRAITPLFAGVSYANLSHKFARACHVAGIPQNITPHDLRRTYGTRMAHLVSTKTLQQLMGHQDTKTTLEHYTVVEISELAAQVTRAGNVMNP